MKDTFNLPNVQQCTRLDYPIVRDYYFQLEGDADWDSPLPNLVWPSTFDRKNLCRGRRKTGNSCPYVWVAQLPFSLAKCIYVQYPLTFQMC